MSDDITAWFHARIPEDWFTEPPKVEVDRDEIVVIGTLAEPDLPDDESDASRRAAWKRHIKAFREATRGQRIRIAEEAEAGLDRKVSWGATCGGLTLLFTHLSIPAMTRLRMRERKVLDTLVDTGVARSRSDALAWCVRLVGKNQDEWLAELREALTAVERVREQGPQA